MDYLGFGYVVGSCPVNLTGQNEAASKLKCSVDKFGNGQYLCVPNFKKTTIVEYCYNGTVGLQMPGSCLVVNDEGIVDDVSCRNFTEGCTTTHFKSFDLYKYPACHQISRKDRCFYADPKCPKTDTEMTTRNSTLVATNATMNDTATTLDFSNTTVITETGQIPAGALAAFTIALFTTLAILLFIYMIYLYKKRKGKPPVTNTDKESVPLVIVREDYSKDEERIRVSLFNGSGDNSEEKESVPLVNVSEDNYKDEERGRVSLFNWSEVNSDDNPFGPGYYSRWKTSLSDKFSTLTDDEVSVLFCFLCSDSGPPDFSDTEWMDLLNEMRQLVYRNTLTREEVQQTLDRLKSCDYLWDDQDKITEDTKDETMYRITSIKYYIPFYYSSYDTASVYLRSEEYNRKPREKCVRSRGCNDLLILRLQMNILTHVTMEDTSIYNKIPQILNVSNQILKESEDKRKEFLSDLRKGGAAVHYRGRSHDSIDHVTWLWRYNYWARPDIVRSCIGLHPHWDIYIIDNKAYRKTSKYHEYTPEVRSLLYCLLLVDWYTLNTRKDSSKNMFNKLKDRYFKEEEMSSQISTAAFPEGILQIKDNTITFKSDNIRHDVMYAFVTECLIEDIDLEFFLNTASGNVITEYCRSWNYERSEGERCLYVPEEPEMLDPVIERLQLDIIKYCSIADTGIRDKIIQRFEIPAEILEWDQEARERYVEYAKRGTQTVHHARGMIVGCAGAGKTTLLKRLLGCSEEDIKEIKSTEGLKVHEEIFDICDESRSFKVKKSQNNNGRVNTANVDSKTLTFFDFGGQCAYYACHQIYLTRRAFYVVVVDASKRLDQKVDEKVCDQDGSVFHGWTYGDYFVFWIKSIHTYCGSDNQKDTKPVVLIVASHWKEENRQFRDTNKLIESLRHQLPKTSNLSQYITDDNVYCVDFTLPLRDLETCIFNIASNQRWRESIPKEWSLFGLEINQKKHKERILKISEITTKVSNSIAKGRENLDKPEKGTQDMLRYYHDAGKVLYFNENDLEEEVIIDVQWFIDAFKHIITDKLHFKGLPVSQRDWDEYYKTGYLRGQLLVEIWKHKDQDLIKNLKKENENLDSKDEDSDSEDELYEVDSRCLQYHTGSLLHFMQRLGLLAFDIKSLYVPCMNRKEIEKELLNFIKESESKSSVLIYQFEFLPFFLFYRLVVACMQEDGWTVLENDGTSCLYRNAALFSYSEYNIVLSVTKDSIQLQVFHPMEGYVLERAQTCRIQGKIEVILMNLAGTFHRKIQFVRGFRCQINEVENIAMDIENHFLPETRFLNVDRKMMCPLHSVTDRHIIDTTKLTKYWEIKRD